MTCPKRIGTQPFHQVEIFYYYWLRNAPAKNGKIFVLTKTTQMYWIAVKQDVITFYLDSAYSCLQNIAINRFVAVQEFYRYIT